MKVVLSNKSNLSNFPSRIVLSNNNKVGKVTFGKIAKTGTVLLTQLGDVNTTGQKEGDILVYRANTEAYHFVDTINNDKTFSNTVSVMQNLRVGGNVAFTNSTNTIVAYTHYNDSEDSIDTIFV